MEKTVGDDEFGDLRALDKRITCLTRADAVAALVFLAYTHGDEVTEALDRIDEMKVLWHEYR